jgi:hypothetical protein
MSKNRATADIVLAELERRGFDLCTIEDRDDDSTIDAADRRYMVDVRCSQCEALVISGVACHETGCPNARPYDCFDCGCEPVKYKHSVCESCANPEPFDEDTEDSEL